MKIATLSNGLRLLCRENNASEIISVVCLVRAGLADETEEQAGLAALTAEALIRGTTSHSPQGFQQAVTLAGGTLRSVPGFDFTEISIVAGKEQFRNALKLIADVVAHPSFTQEAVDAAKQALKQRIGGFREDFTASSYQSLTAQLYAGPYGRPVNGYSQTLEKLTRADVQKFWDTNYIQNRIWVAVVGDIDPAKALDLAQKAFESVPFRPGTVTPQPPAERLAKPKVDFIQRPTPGPPLAQVMVGFLAPGTTKENYAAYAVLDGIIGGGKRARLFTNIRSKQNVGYELGSFYQPLLFQSHLVGYVMLPYMRRNEKTGQPEQVPIEPIKGYLVDQFRQLATTGPTDQELARAKNYVVGRYALRQERTRDQAKWLAWNSAMRLGEDFDDKFASRVYAVTKEQIAAAARESFGSYALVVTVPQPQPDM